MAPLLACFPVAALLARAAHAPRSSRAQHRGAARVAARASREATGQLDSLVPASLEELAANPEQQELMAALAVEGQAALTARERRARQRSLDDLDAPPFGAVLADAGVTPLRRAPATILQLNIGLYCNQACSHCHVESSPLRKEAMDRATAERCVALLAASPEVGCVDITGGAPELNPQFRFLVRQARALGREVLDRCNLTVLLEPGQEDLVQFLADNQVHVVASLPCYSEANVDTQRGRGVFDRSILGLQRLNAAGYGVEGSGLQLDLVYNPGGAFLAPPQATLQDAYKIELFEAHGIQFNNLLALNNMPIKRFHDFLVRKGQLKEYLALLVDNFNPAAAEGVMCRDIVSVGWDGRIFDCDFNQQLEMGMSVKGKPDATVFDIDNLAELTGAPIACDNHCFGCTAGSGSGCSGATS